MNIFSFDEQYNLINTFQNILRQNKHTVSLESDWPSPPPTQKEVKVWEGPQKLKVRLGKFGLFFLLFTLNETCIFPVMWVLFNNQQHKVFPSVNTTFMNFKFNFKY